MIRYDRTGNLVSSSGVSKMLNVANIAVEDDNPIANKAVADKDGNIIHQYYIPTFRYLFNVEQRMSAIHQNKNVYRVFFKFNLPNNNVSKILISKSNNNAIFKTQTLVIKPIAAIGEIRKKINATEYIYYPITSKLVTGSESMPIYLDGNDINWWHTNSNFNGEECRVAIYYTRD